MNFNRETQSFEVYKNKNGGWDAYPKGEYKFTNAKVDEDARTIIFDYLVDNKNKVVEISFSVLKLLIDGKISIEE